jgi:hypothetical protein
MSCWAGGFWAGSGEVWFWAKPARERSSRARSQIPGWKRFQINDLNVTFSE